jgi:2-keto-4-pentenoate hydratase
MVRNMILKSVLIEALASEMFEVFQTHHLKREAKIDPSSLSLAEAYEAQARMLALRLLNGERIVGWKVGCTSRAIRQQFGLSHPISGRLLEPHIYPNGSSLAFADYINCAIEPEMVIRLGKDLEGNVDERTAAEAIASIAPGIEIHNYRFWFGSPTSQELIASNGIHAALIIGPEQQFRQEIDLAIEGVEIWVNGQLQASGTGAEIMDGGPLNSLCWLAHHAYERGEILRAGNLVIPGSAVRLIKLKAGDRIESRFTLLGKCTALVI